MALHKTRVKYLKVVKEEDPDHTALLVVDSVDTLIMKAKVTAEKHDITLDQALSAHEHQRKLVEGRLIARCLKVFTEKFEDEHEVAERYRKRLGIHTGDRDNRVDPDGEYNFLDYED